MFELSGFSFSESTLDCMFMMADLDGDGSIQIQEAVPYMRAIISDHAFAPAVLVPTVKMPCLSSLSPKLLDR